MCNWLWGARDGIGSPIFQILPLKLLLLETVSENCLKGVQLALQLFRSASGGLLIGFFVAGFL